jgi:hypothetical protein
VSIFCEKHVVMERSYFQKVVNSKYLGIWNTWLLSAVTHLFTSVARILFGLPFFFFVVPQFTQNFLMTEIYFHKFGLLRMNV